MAHVPHPDEERYAGGDGRRRRKRGAWWLPLLLLLLLLALAGILAALFAGGDDSKASSRGDSTSGAVAGASTSEGGSSSRGRLTANGASLLPLAAAALKTRAGQRVQARQVKVVGVPGDEVFWVGNASRRVLVHLEVGGESGPKVRTGDVATFAGTLQRNTADAAADYGVTAAEGASLLQRQGVHVEADVRSLKLAR